MLSLSSLILGVVIQVLIPGSQTKPQVAWPDDIKDNCSHNRFQCSSNGICVPERFRCDGDDDCGDASDEHDCLSCRSNSFLCPNRVCIRESYRCDGSGECYDGSDELNCQNYNCSDNRFQCPDGICISQFRICDGYIHCDDGFDEENCQNHTCMDNWFQCPSGVCLDPFLGCDGDTDCLCDGYINCPDGSDELNCHYTSSVNEIKCSNGASILQSSVCNGHDDCGDGSDEQNCQNHTCSVNQFQCSSNGICKPQSYVCDLIKDCDDESDELDCQNYACSDNLFQCSSNGICMPQSHVCDAINDCDDGSDELNCQYCNHDQCGVVNSGKILGGTDVNPKRKYPWMVGILQAGFKISCGGTIINDRWILTSAHCFTNKTSCTYSISRDYAVVVGEHNQLDRSDDISDTQKYNIKYVIKHPNYDCGSFAYDFALLQLQSPITFNSIIRPVCLPTYDGNTYVGKSGTVIGWGRTSNGGSESHTLREVQLEILANDNCGKWNTLPAEEMCARGQVAEDHCKGDSGGPLHVVENGKYVQVGVVSHLQEGEGCGSADYPGVYARVSKVLPWITDTTSNGNKCN